MIIFEFSRIEKSSFANDFDQGHISLTSERLCISSKLNQKHSNMIYISIANLIDGLTRNNKHFDFIAADSSFRIKFKRQKETITVLYENILNLNVNYSELLHALDQGIDRFLSNPHNCLPASSAVNLDLLSSKASLRHQINKRL